MMRMKKKQLITDRRGFSGGAGGAMAPPQTIRVLVKIVAVYR